jgi:bifunctional DNA-binding transcriptional regulator/antitoxin component of YhaV-PrlF toxin-antitoxin module
MAKSIRPTPTFKLTSKGQVTIPQHIREQAGIALESEVTFEVRKVGGKTEVLIRPVIGSQSALRTALETSRGMASATEFKAMNTDEFMKYLRG